jgi:telomerase reverse transcriptase
MEWFPWCGLMINTHSLDICYDYSRYKDIRCSVTSHVSTYNYIWISLSQVIKLRCKPILLDTKLNSGERVIKNLYQIFLYSAMKFHWLIKCYFKSNGSCNRNTIAAAKLMHMIIKCTNKLHRNIRKSRPLRKSGDYIVPSYVSKWLSFKAFQVTLRRKQSLHTRLISMIAKNQRKIQLDPYWSYILSKDILKDCTLPIKY